MFFNNLASAVGNTPLIALDRYCVATGIGCRILAKVESFNPMSSVKDRAALFMLNDAEEKGILKKNGTVVEPTSGNTGIGLSWLCAIRGYKMILTMPETMSPERIKLAEYLGAKVVLTPASEGMDGAVRRAEEIAVSSGAFMPMQFSNPANAEAHRQTTAPEILKDTDGKIDFFVAGIGSGGTVTGVGEVLKSTLPHVKIVGVEPEGSPLLTQGKTGKHKIQGIGANFVPELLNRDILDEVVAVKDEDAMDCARLLARTEGIVAGISSGAALRAATEIAGRNGNEGKTVVVLLADTGERYLSTELFS